MYESEARLELADVRMVWREAWGSLTGREKGPGAKNWADIHLRGQKQVVLCHACPRQGNYEDDGDEGREVEKESLTLWERCLG